MLKFLFILFFININISFAETKSGGYDVFDHIKQTQTLNVGARTDTVPFSFRNQSGDFDGISIDIAKEIHKQLEQELKIKIKLVFIPVLSETRIQMIVSNKIDLECGITVPTWERDKLVDFSIPFFIDYVKLFTINKDIYKSKIGVLKGSITGVSVTRQFPNISIVEISDMNVGMEKIRKGELDGLANIYILLKTLIKNTKMEKTATFIPDTAGFSVSYLTCMVPEDDSDWRDFVNKTISDLLVGINEFRGSYIKIYNKWFDKNGYIYYPIDVEIAKRLSPTMWFY